jgi:hypothetical protein
VDWTRRDEQCTRVRPELDVKLLLGISRDESNPPLCTVSILDQDQVHACTVIAAQDERGVAKTITTIG